MLKNDPPSGTKVRFLRELREAKPNDNAVLVRPLRTHTEENPEDLVEVQFQGESLIVQRRDIE